MNFVTSLSLSEGDASPEGWLWATAGCDIPLYRGINEEEFDYAKKDQRLSDAVIQQ